MPFLPFTLTLFSLTTHSALFLTNMALLLPAIFLEKN